MGLDALRPGATATVDSGAGGDAEGGSGAPPAAPAARPAFVPLSRERVLADVQLQGAISDFHVIRDAVRAADYDPLLVRSNEGDAYDDGGNFEVRRMRACMAASGAHASRRARAQRSAMRGLQPVCMPTLAACVAMLRVPKRRSRARAQRPTPGSRQRSGGAQRQRRPPPQPRQQRRRQPSRAAARSAARRSPGWTLAQR
jgi:hypothetical protein